MSPASDSESRPHDAERVSVVHLANLAIRRWRVLVGIPLAFAAISSIVVLILRPQYVATADFVPETKQSSASLGNLAGIAAQFGVGLPGGGGSAQFYAAVLQSSGISDSVLLTSYTDPRSPGRDAALLDILDVHGTDQRERLFFGREQLKQIVAVHVDLGTNIVSVATTLPYPQLAADVSNRYLTLLDQFNSKVRGTSGRERRVFVEGRLAQAQRELDSAQAAQTGFLERNREFSNSPVRALEYSRLQQEVLVRSTLLSTLRTQYEQAKIDEADDTPLVTIVDRAQPPGHRTTPRRTLDVLLSTAFGFVVAALMVLTHDYWVRGPEQDQQELSELSARVSALRERVRSIGGSRRPR